MYQKSFADRIDLQLFTLGILICDCIGKQFLLQLPQAWAEYFFRSTLWVWETSDPLEKPRRIRSGMPLSSYAEGSKQVNS